MDNLLSVLKDYKESKHLEIIASKIKKEYLICNMVSIYNNKWELPECPRVPYEIITHILDSYSHIPYRPDLSFIFCWQGINNSYNELILKDSSKNILQDTTGLELLINEISNNYEEKYKVLIDAYIDKMPKKTGKYIANYILKGYVIEENGFSPKFNKSSYKTFCKKFPDLSSSIKQSYGLSYKSICNPSIIDDKISLNISNYDKNKSIKIIHSLSNKILELIKTKSVEFKSSDKTNTFNHTLSNKELIQLILFSILYSSRCNNFHGNVASRLNTIYLNEDTYKYHKYIFLLAHNILAIALHINGYIEYNDLLKLKENENLL